jgi:hypothetical protein
LISVRTVFLFGVNVLIAGPKWKIGGKNNRGICGVDFG